MFALLFFSFHSLFILFLCLFGVSRFIDHSLGLCIYVVVLKNNLLEIKIECISLLQRLEYHTPLSFEQALAMGRTGRVLPSPVLNGYKPKGLGFPSGRHSDSDEEDWC